MEILDKSMYTPMMQQYLTIKENYQDTLIFFRLGDFYELFFNDALVASRVLEIALTGRDAGASERVPMCGVPFHSADSYIQKLVDNGFKVAIVEQIEDPKEAKGIVKRDVVRLITPGTVMDQKYINEKTNNYIASISDFITNYAISYCDLTTGEVFVTLIDKDEKLLINEILSIETKEIIVSSDFNQDLFNLLNKTYNLTISVENNVALYDEYKYLCENIVDSRLIYTVARLVNYLLGTQKRSLKHLQQVTIYHSNQFLVMDIYSKRNLELVETLRSHSRKGSLLWLIDKASTAMGSRLIKQWIDKPLVNITDINRRYDIISALQNDFIVMEELKESLKNVYDLERIVGRIAYDNANARDLLQLKRSLHEMPFIKERIMYLNQTNSVYLNVEFDTFDYLYTLLENSINEDAPYTIKDGSIIKDHFNEDLDKYRDASRNGKEYIAELLTREKERTGIKSLKVGFNKVFGYYIEITKSYLDLLPANSHFERKQTLANAERFVTPELKELEALILNAEEKSVSLEYDLFIQIRYEIKSYIYGLQKLAKAIAEIDALISFATVSNENRFIRPTLVNEHMVNIKNGRHPVVEKLLNNGVYVENDIIMDEQTNILLITGPNMSGKSTYMRQMALMVILSQIGCFVPADFAVMKVFDKIFTRIGASDDLISGQSTFMVEMIEANNAIKHATENSLILFDEIGRGTATFDGMALAQAIIEYIHEKIKAKTLFSTHYHELTVLENQLETLKNVHVRAEERNNDLTFLHKVEFGPSDKSYGIQVAKLAELPITLIKRAEKILKNLELNKKDAVIETEANLFDFNFNEEPKNELSEHEVEALCMLKDTNVYELTPLDALNLLYKLQNKLKNK